MRIKGFTGNSFVNEAMTGLSEKADVDIFIAVFPNEATDILFYDSNIFR